ncbi:MAG: hypothetical protein ACYDD6_01510 [Acidimicrobiales bacterium]
MTPSDAVEVQITEEVRAALDGIVSAYAARRPGWGWVDPVRIVEVEALRQGRPGILDVVAEVGERTVHVPLGLRAPNDQYHFLPDGEDPVLGLFEDAEGKAVAFDALRDPEVIALLLRAVSGERADHTLVRQIRIDEASVTLGVEDRFAFTVFNDMISGPRPSTEVVLALDEVGFNHLAAPIALWRRGAWDLGFVQEHLAGGSTGWALALTSVRDLYASGGSPDMAGGDFGAEAHRLGTMSARMHLGLEAAFGHQQAQTSAWADAIEEVIRAGDSTESGRPEVTALLEDVRSLSKPGYAIRTHGDFHLGRVWRTEQGWYVSDFSPGGRPVGLAHSDPEAAERPPAGPGGARFMHRSPLADVADMMWSFGHVAASAATERDPTGREGLDELAQAWQQRNRRAFLAGYLGVPGITTVVPAGREAVRVLVAAFELERRARWAGPGS